MSDKSPLFISAVELLAHSIELFTQGNERKYKFVILHLANSIELILKDRLIDKGVTIYEGNSNRTLNIWTVFTELGKVSVKVPERPVIELLVDDRNTIQHRFGFPNSDTVFYYLDQVITFFKRFLSDEYSVDIAEVLKLYVSDDDLGLFGLVEKPKDKEDKYASLDDLFTLSPESAVLQAYNLVESKFMQIMPEATADNKPPRMIWLYHSFPHVLDDLVIHKFIAQETISKFIMLRQMRNRSAHTAHFKDDQSSPDWAEALKVAKDFLYGLDKAIESGYVRREPGSDEGISNQ